MTDAIVALAEAHAAHVLRELKETLDEDADRTPVGRDPFDFGKAIGLATAIDAIDELLDLDPHGIEVPK